MEKVIAVLGGGAFGTAVAIVFSGKNIVRLWVRNKEMACKMLRSRENEKYLSGVKIPDRVIISSDLGEVIEGADLIILAVPSFGIRDVLEAIVKVSEFTGKNLFDFLPSIPMIGLAKGVEKDTQKLPSEVVEDVCKIANIPYFHLSGPGFARDIAEGKEVTEVLASTNKELALELQQILETPQFRIVFSDDLIGLQAGGALKNVLSIALAIVEEVSGEDQETKNKMFSLCAEELFRAGVALGGSEEGLSAAEKDLLLSAGKASFSRNAIAGIRMLYEGFPKIKEEIRKKKLTSEGISSAEAVYQLCKERGIEAPIIREIALIVSEEQTPEQGARNLIELVRGAK